VGVRVIETSKERQKDASWVPTVFKMASRMVCMSFFASLSHDKEPGANTAESRV
jgi:hypothetical protein